MNNVLNHLLATAAMGAVLAGCAGQTATAVPSSPAGGTATTTRVHGTFHVCGSDGTWGIAVNQPLQFQCPEPQTLVRFRSGQCFAYAIGEDGSWGTGLERTKDGAESVAIRNCEQQGDYCEVGIGAATGWHCEPFGPTCRQLFNDIEGGFRLRLGQQAESLGIDMRLPLSHCQGFGDPNERVRIEGRRIE